MRQALTILLSKNITFSNRGKYRNIRSTMAGMITKFLVGISLFLLLSAGCETRPLNPTMVSKMVVKFSRPPIQAAEADGGAGKNGWPDRLSPGGPDGHHHR